MKLSIRSLVGRSFLCAALLNLSVPGGALVTFGKPVKDSVDGALARHAREAKELSTRRAKSASRPLTEKEERSFQGRAGENPYLAGQNKWDVIYKGVNLMSGNYTTCATDMSFDGGYGIPVNVTRSYSANSGDEGPYGKGWTLSADVRSTAGGLIKSGSAPVRSIPTTLKERPSTEDDPNVAAEPAQAVSAIDAGGQEETVQKDVDGILTTPPWDKNTYDPVYEWVTLGGQKYQVMVSQTVKTPEGTVYTYAKKGYYDGGTYPWNNPSATHEAANVLKVTSATDRQGNVTTYTYGSGTVTFQKSNGTTVENPLTSVTMPGGHTITFHWGTTSSLPSFGRITSIDDGAGGRTVSYTYTGSAGHGLLQTVTTPGGKTTTYGYGTAATNPDYTGSVATDLLTSMTDPRGLTTTMDYGMANELIYPYRVAMNGAVCYRVIQPDGKRLYVDAAGSDYYTAHLSEGGTLDHWDVGIDRHWEEWAGGTRVLNAGLALPSGSGVLSVRTYESFGDGAERGNAGATEAYGPSHSIVQYSLTTQDLVWRVDYADAYLRLGTDLSTARGLRTSSGSADDTSKTVSTTSYNFLGQPLSKTTTEYRYTGSLSSGAFSQARTATVDYAYWGADKYYQQKAVKDQAGRYSYTDYYARTDVAGKRGQTYRVYDPKNAGFTTTADAQHPAPPKAIGQTQADYDAKVWKYTLHPTSDLNYSAQFDYDAQGRPIDVWKLQKTTTSPWSYVQTHTTYGADGENGTWGQAYQVVEDYGGLNRTTTTSHYTSWGKADEVTDAAGHHFVTNFDGDGVVQSVTRTDVTPHVAVVSYAYGSTAGTVTYGQPTSVTDGLSGVVQSISYTASGAGIGQPSSVTETNGSDSYTVSYTYNGQGERATATYATPAGTTKWGYADYVSVGDPAKYSRVFQTMRRLDSSGNPTSEEFHYAYDAMGRLRAAAFAQSPQSGFTPSTGGSWYDGHAASVRARAWYGYDAGGRLTSLEHYWDTASGGSYASEAVLANQCDYELSGSNRGLKTASRFYVKNASSPATFSLERTETYGYDVSLDYLTSASYGDGLPNANPTWSYDAAGNRSDAVADNLNRATSLGGVAVTNDVLGNRLTKSGTTYGWDVLNRLTSLSGGVSATYAYRSDGMRIAKGTGGVTTTYRYDGQMGMEDVETSASATTVTRYGLGARGVDLIERTQGSTTTLGFPIYDAHGNNVATLSRNGSGYSVNDRRSYDAWGVVRAQQSGGDPTLRYCANLGHKQDDESGLIYMRARYYEPSSGRFISEDAGRDGHNWLVYAANDPINQVDRSGKESLEQVYDIAFASAFFGGVGYLLGEAMVSKFTAAEVWKAAISSYLLFTIGIGAANHMKDFAEIPVEEFKAKMSWASWSSGAIGTLLGTTAALKLGNYMGQAAVELFYIDYWDVLP